MPEKIKENIVNPNFYIPLLIAVTVLVFMYQDVVAKMVQDWWIDPNYSHGFLIPLISIYLIYECRGTLKIMRPHPSFWGLPILLIGICLFLIGQIAGELFTQRISLIIVLAGLIVSFGGPKIWKIVWLPVTYLIFMVPLPYLIYDTIAFPLKLWATKISTFVLQLLGVPIFSEGNLINLPNIVLEVADACSGIRSLISVLALSTIIALYTQRSTKRRMLLIIASVPVVLFCNMARIIITGLLAQKNPELARGFFHSFSGEAMFLVGVFIIFVLARFIGKDEKKRTFQGIMTSRSEHPSSRQPVVTWASSFLLLAAFGASLFTSSAQAIPLKRSLSQFPDRIDGFIKMSEESFDKALLKNLGVDHYLMWAYKGPGSYPLWLYIGYYEDQKEGAMIHSPKHCYPGGGWHPLSSRIVDISIPHIGKKINVNEYILTKGGEKQLVYYWYQSRGRVIVNEYKDRFYMIMDSLFRHRSDGALIRISGPAKDLEKARFIQVDFIKKIYPIISNYLPS